MIASEYSAFEPYRRPSMLRADAAPFVSQRMSPLMLVPSAVYAGMQEPRMGPQMRIARVHHQMQHFQERVQTRKGRSEDIETIKWELHQQVDGLRLSIMRTFEALGTLRRPVRIATLLRLYHFLIDHPYVFERCEWLKEEVGSKLQEFHTDTMGHGELQDAEGLVWGLLQ